MSAAVYMGVHAGCVYRDLDFAGRSISFATYRDGARGARLTCAATVGSTTVKGTTTDEVFDRLVTALDAVERVPTVARVLLRTEVALALHGDPLPPQPEPITTVRRVNGRPCLVTLT